MSAKFFLVFCAQALFVQSALSQCTSRAVAAAPGIAAPAFASPYDFGASYGLGAPYGLAASPLAGPYGIATSALAAPGLDYTPTSGGLLPLSSGSGIAPFGISVTSENIYEGPLAVTGELPFVGTVGLEGVLPTSGVGVVNHACGNGVNAMVGDSAGYGSAYTGAGVAPFGGIAPAAAMGPVIGTPRPGWPFSYAPELAAPGLAAPGLEITPTSGGLLPISSGSAIAPVGISVASENMYEGPLAVTGELPFVGTVGIEGVLPTAGNGIVNHSCGNGANAMISENAAFTPAYAGAIAPAAAFSPFGAIAPAATIASGIAAPALGWAGRGYGCAL